MVRNVTDVDACYRHSYHSYRRIRLTSLFSPSSPTLSTFFLRRNLDDAMRLQYPASLLKISCSRLEKSFRHCPASHWPEICFLLYSRVRFRCAAEDCPPHSVPCMSQCQVLVPGSALFIEAFACVISRLWVEGRPAPCAESDWLGPVITSRSS